MSDYPQRLDYHNMTRQESLSLINPGNEVRLPPRIKQVKTVHVTLKFNAPARLINNVLADPEGYVARGLLETEMIALATTTAREWVDGLLAGNIKID